MRNFNEDPKQGWGHEGPGRGERGRRRGGRDEARGERRGHGEGHGPDEEFGEGFGPHGPMPGAPRPPFLFGPGFPGGPGGGRGRGRRGPGRGARGDVRNSILALLSEQPYNGYGLIQAIADKTQGLWSPGPGSVYPALGLLEDEGLIEATEHEGKKAYTLSEQGRAWAQEHADQLSEPWAKVSEPHEGFLDVGPSLAQLGMAVKQVVVAGDQEQLAKVKSILDDARKSVYRLLAE